MAVLEQLVCTVGMFAVVGCASAPPSAPSDGPLSVGTWGGEHVALMVSAEGARLEFDCANGEITQPLTIDGNGNLSVEGVYVREHGGPIRDGEVPNRQPAVYSGKLNGNTLTFEVTVKLSNQSMGTYTVTLGGDARVRKCL